MQSRRPHKPAPMSWVVKLEDPGTGNWVEVDEEDTRDKAEGNASRSRARTGLNYRSRERTSA